MKLLAGECHRTSQTGSMHWYRSGNGLVPAGKQAITWANVGPDPCRHMAPLCNKMLWASEARTIGNTHEFVIQKMDMSSRCHISRSLQWRHNEIDSVSNHQPPDCLLNRLFRRRSRKTSKLRVTGLCAGNSPVTGEFPAQMASNAQNVSIWWRHHVKKYHLMLFSVNDNDTWTCFKAWFNGMEVPDTFTKVKLLCDIPINFYEQKCSKISIGMRSWLRNYIHTNMGNVITHQVSQQRFD